jgi:transposase
LILIIHHLGFAPEEGRPTMEWSMEEQAPAPPFVHPPEFKAEIVELCQRGDRSAGQVAKDFDLAETAVREWVKQAGRDAGTHHDGGMNSTERRELPELRRENRRLREDVEILKRATAFFAGQTRSMLTVVHLAPTVMTPASPTRGPARPGRSGRDPRRPVPGSAERACPG